MTRFGRQLRIAALVVVGACATWQANVACAQDEGLIPVGDQPPVPSYFNQSEPFVGCCGKGEHGKDGCCLNPQYPAQGVRRAPFALFEIDSARPDKKLRFQLDDANHVNRPDRAEYFWAREQASGGGRGPANAETNVNYQDFRIYMENGTDDIAFLMDLGIRNVDPSNNQTTANFKDMMVGIKSRFVETDHCDIAFIFKTWIPTGSVSKGLGTGHVSLEPGLLANYHCNDYTWFHGQAKWWIPLGGDTLYQGSTFIYGVGVSHVLWQSPCKYLAFIPTCELVGWQVLDGAQTLPGGAIQMANGDAILNFQPGLRIPLCKHIETGFSGAYSLTGEHWYDQLFRWEFSYLF